MKEVASRPPAALSLWSFQMLRYQFWGFCLFTFGLYAKNLVESGGDNLGLAHSVGGGGFLGGALGLVLAQKWKDRVAPNSVLLMGAMFALGVDNVDIGWQVGAGLAALISSGSSRSSLERALGHAAVRCPTTCRGRALALFDIAYNLGFIIPALVLVVGVDPRTMPRARADPGPVGLIFVALTLVIYLSSDPRLFAPQDDSSTPGRNAVVRATA